jgi:hypothetical protein
MDAINCRNLLIALVLSPALSALAADTDPPPRAYAPPQGATTPPAVPDPAPDSGYDRDDEPPLDYYQRQWRWFTQHATPQRFAGADLRRVYGSWPPFHPGYGAWSTSWGDCAYGAFAPYAEQDVGQSYIQGRYDERRFQQWKNHHDRNKAAYLQAMGEGIHLFREAQYPAAVGQFVLAARLHQGDPASRLHAAYSLVAIGNYSDAVLMIRRAMQLQDQLPYLPLDIRAEYGPNVDFDAHLQRLTETVRKTEDDPGQWMLLGYYRFFSGNAAGALEALTRAKELAPRDPLIADLHEAVRLRTPSSVRP